MSSELDNSEEILRKITDVNSLVAELHCSGKTISQSVKILVNQYSFCLAEVKERVSAHPVWQAVTGDLDRLHQAIIDYLENPDKKATGSRILESNVSN